MSDKNYGYVSLTEEEKELQKNPHKIRNGCMQPKPLAQMIKKLSFRLVGCGRSTTIDSIVSASKR
jgi:hypothetical protein